MQHSLVLIAYHYPPENAIGAARPARFVCHLPAYGWDCEVLTAASQPFDPATSGHGGGHVHWLEDRSKQHWEGAMAGSHRLGDWQRYGELIARRFLFPGAIGLTWGLEVPSAARGHIASAPHAPSAVLSTFPPLAAHVAGWRMSRTLGVPWIADFRDPLHATDSRGSRRLPDRATRWLESRVMHSAAAIIVNTEAMAGMYRKRYPAAANKVHVIWNGFDPDDSLEPLPIPPRAKRVFSHVGSLYAGRNPVAILESLERLRAAANEAALGCEVLLVGPNSSTPAEQAVIDHGVAQGWVKLDARKIPQQDARRISQQSDGLLLLQPQSSVQVPGKLFEYVRIGRPILSLAPRHSPIEWILDRCGVPHTNLYPDDGPEVADGKIASYLKGDSHPVAASAWFQENFNAAAQARQLAALLNRVMEERAKAAH